ncbi:MAG TPA: aminotransferase class V-fold PLP-dependent enzyme [Verrucomicrobiae bacterium]|jgi:aspartate aminotransferase-like enzyme|nr:aminotransferase class V-fold PLP-dependent enzyme [Verrucomicrobiae bacterium]
MSARSLYMFKIADQPSEFEQIHRLNYRTFVEEIPQHGANAEQVLTDKFHQENTYMIASRGDVLKGMVCVRGLRPFSLDAKLPNLDSYLPRGARPCEIRLLSVERDCRNGKLLFGLLELLARHCKECGYDIAVISGTLRQQKLYRHLGFVPFGPIVGVPAAAFQPMYITREAFKATWPKLVSAPNTSAGLVNLLPGPVGIAPEVRRDFGKAAVSHRSDAFIADFQETRRLLCALTCAQHVEILMGSGTVANDAVAAQLTRLPGRGLILSNGEFGDRLVDQAERWGLSFATLRTPWGNPFRAEEVLRKVDRCRGIRWLWAVHCETSTGVLNDIDSFKRICREHNLRLCMDCISSIGSVPIDLTGVYLATGVSGKGLAAFPGLSMVFYNHTLRTGEPALPRYLDLGFYAAHDGIPFTLSSNLVYALKTALLRRNEESFERSRHLSRALREGLKSVGFRIIASDSDAAPAVITIALPPALSSLEVGRRLDELGYTLSYKSGYLIRRNWIQICLMGECNDEKVLPVLDALGYFCPPQHLAAL